MPLKYRIQAFIRKIVDWPHPALIRLCPNVSPMKPFVMIPMCHFCFPVSITMFSLYDSLLTGTAISKEAYQNVPFVHEERQ